jgi:hypothetical protein
MLTAMGADASSEQAALFALKSLEDAEWNNPLPPVVVAYVDAQPIQIPIVRPVGSGSVHWLLTLEDGTKRCGESDSTTLTLLEERSHLGRLLQLVFDAFNGQRDIARHNAFKNFVRERASLLERPAFFRRFALITPTYVRTWLIATTG